MVSIYTPNIIHSSPLVKNPGIAIQPNPSYRFYKKTIIPRNLKQDLLNGPPNLSIIVEVAVEHHSQAWSGHFLSSRQKKSSEHPSRVNMVTAGNFKETSDMLPYCLVNDAISQNRHMIPPNINQGSVYIYISYSMIPT